MSAPGTKSERGTAAFLAMLAIVVLLLPLLYVAALGPLVWLNDRGCFDSDSQEALTLIYWPVESAARECQPLGTALEWYVSLWTPPAPPPRLPAQGTWTY